MTVLNILDDFHTFAQPVDARVFCRLVLVVVCRKVSIQKSDCRHILQTVIAIRRIVQWPLLINDANRRLVRRNDNSLDLVNATRNLFMQLNCTFDGCLRVKFSWKRDFKQYILHDIRSERPRQHDLLATHDNVLKSPLWCRKRVWITHFVTESHEGEPHCTASRITCGP